jgi:hypothetical protein
MWTIAAPLLIPHSREPRLLMQVEGGAWRLPSVTIRAENWMYDTRLLRPAILEALGLDATVLRRIHLADDEDTETALTAYELEPHGDAGRIAGTWLSTADLARLTPGDDRVVPVVQRRLAEADGHPAPPQRMPWAFAGWYAEVCEWTAGQLARLGRRAGGEPVQHQTNGISCVLRVPTDAGDMFFKQAAALPLFCNEPRLIEWLAARAPELAPTPAAADPQRRWLLLEDRGQPFWSGAADQDWLAVTRAHARLQRSLAGEIPALLAAGCVDRRLEGLPAQIAELLADETLGLEPEKVRRTREHLPRVEAMCGELAALGVPQTLVHADLHGGNIVGGGGRAAIIDWTDACVSHPFFDLLTITDHPDTPEHLRASLRAAYLEEWSGVADAARRERAWALAQPLAALHQAVSYRGIVTGIEPDERPIFDEDLPHFLHLALDILDAAH